MENLKVDILQKKGCLVEIKIEIPPEEVKREMESVFADIQKNATIAGFRKDMPQWILSEENLQKQHRIRQEAQGALRESIALWAGHQRAKGRPDSEIYRRFYFKFGTDIMTAQTLGRPDAHNLTERIDSSFSGEGVV